MSQVNNTKHCVFHTIKNSQERIRPETAQPVLAGVRCKYFYFPLLKLFLHLLPPLFHHLPALLLPRLPGVGRLGGRFRGWCGRRRLGSPRAADGLARRRSGARPRRIAGAPLARGVHSIQALFGGEFLLK